MTRDEAATHEFRETRALAINSVVEALSNRAIALRMDLYDCMQENERLKKRVAELEKENASPPGP